MATPFALRDCATDRAIRASPTRTKEHAHMHDTRRRLLGTGAWTTAALLLPRAAPAAAASPPAAAATPAAEPPSASTPAPAPRSAATPTADLAPDAVPPVPATPPPGRPGEFDFLSGEWRIRNRSLVGGQWLEYEGEASVYGILAGVGSVEELRIPARGFAGLGLRLLDVERRVWADHWVNAKSGVLTTPGQAGGFTNGVGIFSSSYEENGRTMLAAGIWDAITPTSCRWRQVVSADGGKHWEHNWIMRWERVVRG